VRLFQRSTTQLLGLEQRLEVRSALRTSILYFAHTKSIRAWRGNGDYINIVKKRAQQKSASARKSACTGGGSTSARTAGRALLRAQAAEVLLQGLRDGVLRVRAAEEPVQGLRDGLLRARAAEEPVQALHRLSKNFYFTRAIESSVVTTDRNTREQMQALHLLLLTTVLLATTAGANENDTALCCFRRGEVDLAKCSHQAWWTAYTLDTQSWTEHAGFNCGGPRVSGPDPFMPRSRWQVAKRLARATQRATASSCRRQEL
jgi:hypothetical protein